MKLRFALFLIVPLALFAAEGNRKDQKQTAKSAAAAPAARPAGKTQVPEGAVSLGPGLWRHTDASGKTWIYRETPFGIARTAETAKPAAEEVSSDLKAVECAGRIQFERSSPFGVARWSRAQDQLSDAERRVWERDCVKKDAATKE